MITPRQARHGRPLPSATISLVVCVAAATFHPAPSGAQSRPDDRADADRLAPPAIESLHNQDRRFAAQQALNEFLVRDRQYTVLLSRADAEIAEGRAAAVLETLQSVLDAPGDVFLWPGQGGRPVSARATAAQFLFRLPGAARANYERRHGDAARRLWDDYCREPDPALLAELLHRFACTRAGHEALRTMAVREMDHGNMPGAAAWWKQVLSDPEFAGAVSIEDRVRAQVAFELGGFADVSAALPPDQAMEILTFAGANRTATDWVQEYVRRFRSNTRIDAAVIAADWTVPFGDAGRWLHAGGSRPVAEPLWSASYLAPQAVEDGGIVQTAFTSRSLPESALASAVSQWTSARQEQRAPLAAATFPVVVGGLVVARDYSHITVRDVRTGTVAWRYACASSFNRVLSELGPDAVAAPANVATARSSDRPTAMFAFDAAFAENSVLGMLTSDGRRVFFVDDIAAETPQAAGTNAPAGADQPVSASRRVTNRLLALPLASRDSTPGGRPLWSVGGPLADASADSLAGCYFLGPPVPDGDRLFVLAEFRNELHLLALAAASGQLLWRQPVALVDIPLDDDPLRARLACCPTVAHGVVVCPTQLGTLVGVNAATGTLLWVYSHVEEAGPHHVGRWQHAANRRFGSAVFPDLPLVVGSRVIVLPHQSEFVHCLELQTGAALWPPQPRDGALFAAVGNTDMLLLIGARQCVARHLHDGRPLWKTRIDSPVGRGLVAGDQYLLPTARGTVASLEISTGRVLGNLVPASSCVTTTALRPAVDADADSSFASLRADDTPPLGNLCLYEDLLVTTSPLGIAAFPQVERTLQSLLARMPPDHAASTDLLRAAELQLQLGQSAPARHLLQRALHADPPADVRARAEARLREVLYAELAGSDAPAAVLAALDELTRNPRERGRFLVCRLESELNSGDIAAALRTVREALPLDIDGPVAMTAGGEYLARPLRRMSALLGRSDDAGLTGPGLLRHDAQPTAVGADCSPAPLDLLGALPNSGQLRLQAAAGHRQAGRIQAAELLLLQAAADPEPETAVAGATMLATLWDDRGLQFEAVAALERTASRRGRMHLPDGATFVEHLERRLPGRKCWQVFRSPATSASVVTIDQAVCPDGCPASGRSCECAALYSLFFGNREFARSPGATLRVIDRGIQPLASIDPPAPSAGTPSRAVRLVVVDRTALRQVAGIDLAPHAWRAGAMDRYDAGHLLPIVGADVYGISFLEGRVLWSLPAEAFDLRDRPSLGPYGPEFCIVQAGGTLTNLDPADGRVLWRRTDLDYDAGFVTDDETGIVGDDRAIVVFDADRVTHRVFDTRSGEPLRSGTLDASPGDLRKRRWNFGRRLLFSSSGKQETRLRLWDPLDDTCPIDVVAHGRLLHHESCRDGLLTMLNENRLTILDVDTNQVLWAHDLDVDQVEGVRGLTAFADHARYYVHLERDVSQGRYSHLNGDVRVPHVQVEGDLFGIDRQTGSFWTRTLPRCNLLLLPQHRLPFLIGISRIRDGQQRQSSMLMVQVIDAATGDLLAQREDLVKTSIVHTAFDPAAGELNLAGVGGRIAIRLRPEGAQEHSAVKRPGETTPTSPPP